MLRPAVRASLCGRSPASRHRPPDSPLPLAEVTPDREGSARPLPRDGSQKRTPGTHPPPSLPLAERARRAQGRPGLTAPRGRNAPTLDPGGSVATCWPPALSLPENRGVPPSSLVTAPRLLSGGGSPLPVVQGVETWASLAFLFTAIASSRMGRESRPTPAFAGAGRAVYLRPPRTPLQRARRRCR